MVVDIAAGFMGFVASFCDFFHEKSSNLGSGATFLFVWPAVPLLLLSDLAFCAGTLSVYADGALMEECYQVSGETSSWVMIPRRLVSGTHPLVPEMDRVSLCGNASLRTGPVLQLLLSGEE